MTSTGTPVVLVAPTTIYSLSCTSSTIEERTRLPLRTRRCSRATPHGLRDVHVSCAARIVVSSAALGDVRAVAHDDDTTSTIIGATNGLFLLTKDTQLSRVDPTPVLSVAYSSVLRLYAAGTQDKISVYRGPNLVRWEWVTDVVNGAGGAYDGPVRRRRPELASKRTAQRLSSALSLWVCCVCVCVLAQDPHTQVKYHAIMAHSSVVVLSPNLASRRSDDTRWLR